MIAEEIEAIFAGQDLDGEVDIDGVLAAFESLMGKATANDVPELLSAIQSPRNNFWTRELISEPICQLGGAAHLDLLFDAAQLNLDEGHDNDGFHFHLSELATLQPEECREKLQALLADPGFKHKEAAEWLMEFCES